MIFNTEEMNKMYSMSLENLMAVKKDYKARLEIVDSILKVRTKNGEKLNTVSAPKERKIEADKSYQQ